MNKRIKSSNRQLRLIKKQLSIKEELYKEGMASYVDVLNMRVQDMNMVREIENLHESVLNENFGLTRLKKQLNSTRLKRTSDYRSKITDINKQVRIKSTQKKALLDKVDRLIVYSPVDGTVDKLNYNYVSAVISPGDSIAEITPLRNTLHGQIKIPRKDIGFIEKGQHVKLKFDTYNFAKYGVIEGVVSAISRGSYDEKDAKFYLAEITLEKIVLEKNGVTFNISPYMEFTADIKTGSRRVIDYMAKPVMAALQESFNER
jgi:HlyD family secretion protein/adhesin transport system membrane fusion protein